MFIDKGVTDGTPPPDGDGMLLASFIDNFDIRPFHALPFLSSTGKGVTFIGAGRSRAHSISLHVELYHYWPNTVKHRLLIRLTTFFFMFQIFGGIWESFSTLGARESIVRQFRRFHFPTRSSMVVFQNVRIKKLGSYFLYGSFFF